MKKWLCALLWLIGIVAVLTAAAVLVNELVLKKKSIEVELDED